MNAILQDSIFQQSIPMLIAFFFWAVIAILFLLCVCVVDIAYKLTAFLKRRQLKDVKSLTTPQHVLVRSLSDREIPAYKEPFPPVVVPIQCVHEDRLEFDAVSAKLYRCRHCERQRVQPKDAPSDFN